MRIYVLRHGIAEERRLGRPDAARKLTPEGKQKLSRVLERARQAVPPPDLVLSSPLVRAVETAAIAAEVLGYRGDIVETDALLPGSTPQTLWQEIQRRKDAESLLLSGHEPHLSASIAFLLGAPGILIDLKKGALVHLQVEPGGNPPRAVLQWMLTAKLA